MRKSEEMSDETRELHGIFWREPEDFSDAFLAKYQELVFYDIFHQVKAFLLLPPNCVCKGDCLCGQIRGKVVLSLNTNLFNKISVFENNLERLYMMRMLLRVPEDSFFRKNYGDSYPLWLIEEELKRREKTHHFKIIHHLVWTLLRLGRTHEAFGSEREASLNEAINFMLGKNPLKAPGINLQRPDYICGEKKLAAYFKKYKPLCHFIAAFERMKQERQLEERFLFDLDLRSARVKSFLKFAQGVREELLLLVTPNIKGKILFTEETLLSLPPWVTSDGVQLKIEPIEEKLKELMRKLRDPLYSVKKFKAPLKSRKE